VQSVFHDPGVVLSEKLHHLSALVVCWIVWSPVHEDHEVSFLHQVEDFVALWEVKLCHRDVVADPPRLHRVFDEKQTASKFSSDKNLRKRVLPRKILDNLSNISVLRDIKPRILDLHLF